MPSSTWKTPTAVDISPDVKTVTTTYAGWVSDWFPCRGFDRLSFLLTFSKDDATTFTLLLEVEDRDGTDGFQDWKTAADGTPSADEIPVPAASLPTSQRITLMQDVATYPKVRLLAKITGGSGTPTLTCEALGA